MVEEGPHHYFAFDETEAPGEEPEVLVQEEAETVKDERQAYENADTVTPEQEAYENADTVSDAYENAETVPRLEKKEAELSYADVVVQFADRMYDLKISPSEQSQVIAAIKAINVEEGRRRLPTGEKEQRALLQRAAERALGRSVDFRFGSPKQEAYKQKQEMDRFIERMAVIQTGLHAQEIVHKALDIVKKGEYWERPPHEIRDTFHRAIQSLEDAHGNDALDDIAA